MDVPVASNNSKKLARSLLDLVGSNKANQTGMMDTCKSFETYVPVQVQGEQDDQIKIPRTFHALRKQAGLATDIDDLPLFKAEICSCWKYVYDEIVAGQKLFQCPKCRKPRQMRGVKREFLIGSTVKKFQRLWANPQLAEYMHYADERKDDLENGDCFEGNRMKALTKQQLFSTAYITWTGDYATMHKNKSYAPIAAMVCVNSTDTQMILK